MLRISLVVFILALNSSTGVDDYEESNWQDYLAAEVDIEVYDHDKAVQEVGRKDELEDDVTARVDSVQAFRFEKPGPAPYSALIYPKTPVDQRWNLSSIKVCGGAMLTREVVMTLCACAHTFLWVLHQTERNSDDLELDGDEPPEKHPADLGREPLYLSPDIDHFRGLKPGRERADYNYQIQLVPRRKGNQQYRNKNCVTAMKTEHFSPMLNELAGVTVVLRFQPPYKEPFADWFAPWPPILIPYNIESKKNKTSYLNDLNLGRAIETVMMTSYGLKPWKTNDKPLTIDGLNIDANHSLLIFYTTLCEQTLCPKAAEFLPTRSPKGPYIADPSSLGCFCDYNNDTVCGGLIGSPAIFNGLLYGLLSETIPCDDSKPRCVIIRGFDSDIIDNITAAVPNLRFGYEIDEKLYRAKSGELDYPVVFPDPQLMPRVDKNLELTWDQVPRAFSNTPFPFIGTAFILNEILANLLIILL